MTKKPLLGPSPFGYYWKNGKLTPHPDEAPVRKKIYELFREHRRKKTVARILNDSGYRTRKQSKFSDTTIDRLLKDPVACGMRRNVKPIVSEELWERCNEILREPVKTGKKVAKKAVHLFAGFAICICKSRMYVLSRSSKYVCLKCKNKILIADLEDIYLGQLKGFLISPRAIRECLQRTGEGIEEKQELLRVLEKNREQLQREMGRLHQLYIEERIALRDFDRRNLPLKEKEKQLANEIARVRAEIEFTRIELLSSMQNSDKDGGLHESWPHLGYQEKRKTVEAITESIVIGRGRDQINVNFSLDPSSLRKQQNGNVST